MRMKCINFWKKNNQEGNAKVPFNRMKLELSVQLDMPK